jgi:hypothetical protein
MSSCAPGSNSVLPADVRPTELFAALSLATDLGSGLPLEHALMTCLVSGRLAAEMLEPQGDAWEAVVATAPAEAPLAGDALDAAASGASAGRCGRASVMAWNASAAASVRAASSSSPAPQPWW